MSFIDNVTDHVTNLVKFEASAGEDRLQQIRKDPERIFVGGATPYETKVTNRVFGTEYEPIVDQWGGATDKNFEKAEERGINTKAGQVAHGIAHIIAAYFAGSYLGSEVGVGGFWGAISKLAIGLGLSRVPRGGLKPKPIEPSNSLFGSNENNFREPTERAYITKGDAIQDVSGLIVVVTFLVLLIVFFKVKG